MSGLKPCPFCGSTIHMGVCDEEGNPRNESYKECPYSGIKFALMHEESDCPIATYRGEQLGMWLYDTEEEATKAWNRRV